MSNKTKLKILLLGPISSGKTTIANFLSNSTDNFTGENRPTKGVRIIEFTAHGLKGKNVFENSTEIELWDCSGDNRGVVKLKAQFLEKDGVNITACTSKRFSVLLDHRVKTAKNSQVFNHKNLYQSCWPSFQHKADGIIFVYSEASNHQQTDLEMLYSFFVEEANFPESSCLVVKNEYGSGKKEKKFENPLLNITHVSVNLEDGDTEFRKRFQSFLYNVIKAN